MWWDLGKPLPGDVGCRRENTFGVFAVGMSIKSGLPWQKGESNASLMRSEHLAGPRGALRGEVGGVGACGCMGGQGRYNGNRLPPCGNNDSAQSHRVGLILNYTAQMG